jgi:coenzyme F420-reducing hydrogenase alpha subunit
MHQGNLDLTLDQITKIEGHASLSIGVRNGAIEKCEFSIAEFKRFYTQAVRGKAVSAIPQMVARICGTCSNAHLLCAIKALENALSIIPSEQTLLLRRLLYNGLIIRDHALHLYMFVLPDIVGKDSLLEFDETNPYEHELLHDAFAVKEAGNKLSMWSGGRSVHAPYPTVGGFISLPDESKKQELIDELRNVRDKVTKLIRIFKECTFTMNEDFDYSALTSDAFDFLKGVVKTTKGGEYSDNEYGKHLRHVTQPYSQASGYTIDGNIMMVGAIARLNLNKDHLHENTKKDAADSLVLFPSNNIFHNNVAQAIEMLHCVDDSIEILKSYKKVDEKPLPIIPKEAVGYAVIEAPRGTLYYRMEIGTNGTVRSGKIIVPTGQNQLAIELAIKHFMEKNPEMLTEEKRDVLSFEFEKIVRAFDPCMSCASHFLKVKIKNQK